MPQSPGLPEAHVDLSGLVGLLPDVGERGRPPPTKARGDTLARGEEACCTRWREERGTGPPILASLVPPPWNVRQGFGRDPAWDVDKGGSLEALGDGLGRALNEAAPGLALCLGWMEETGLRA